MPNLYDLPFPFIREIYSTYLVVNALALQHLLVDIRTSLASSLIHHDRSFSSTLDQSVNLLFFTLPSFSEAFCVLLLTRLEDAPADIYEWKISLQLWGWSDTPLDKTLPQIESVIQQVLRCKLTHLRNEYSLANVDAIVTDCDMVKWLKEFLSKAQNIRLHSICTPSVFFSCFFKILKNSGKIVLESLSDPSQVKEGESRDDMELSDDKIYIGSGFDFM